MGGGNPDSNTLLSDTTTVICLDDYHCLDRFGRKEKGVTALAPEAQDFDLMYNQVKDLKEGKTVGKPIYNHVSGLLDPAEEIESPEILIIEGLHPLRPARARPARLQDLPRHLRRRQVRLEDPARHEGARPLPGVHQGLHRVPQARLRRVHRPPEEGRRRHHRGAAHAAPPRGDRGQRAARSPHPEGGQQAVRPRLLFDEGSTVSWIPCGRKLTCSFPGIKFFYGPDPTTARRSPCWRWTGSSTSWRSSSTWRATSATPPASSTARSPSRCSSPPPSPGPPTARGSSRPSSA